MYSILISFHIPTNMNQGRKRAWTSANLGKRLGHCHRAATICIILIKTPASRDLVLSSTTDIHHDCHGNNLWCREIVRLGRTLVPWQRGKDPLSSTLQEHWVMFMVNGLPKDLRINKLILMAWDHYEPNWATETALLATSKHGSNVAKLACEKL